MANLILPAQTDIALALREPNLLLPEVPPVGNVLPTLLTEKAGVLFSSDLTRKNFGTLTFAETGGAFEGLGTKFIGTDAFETNESISTNTYAAAISFTLTGSASADYGLVTFSVGTGWDLLLWADTSGGQLRLGLASSTNSVGAEIDYSPDGSISIRQKYTVVLNSSVTNGVTAYFYNSKWRLIDTLSVGAKSVSASRKLCLAKRVNNSNILIGYIHGVYFKEGKQLTKIEADAIARNFYGTLFKPANDTPYLISVPTGGATYTLTADAGQFVVTGGAAGLLAARKVAAEPGAFTLTGIAADLVYTPVGSYSLTAEAGTFALNGQAVNLLAGRVLPSDVGAFALTGQAADLIYTTAGAYTLTADAGSFALTGNAANLVYTPAGSYNLTADTGAFALAGQAADLRADRVMPADTGAFLLTGQAVNFGYGVALDAQTGEFALTGGDAQFLRGYSLQAEAGDFALTGIAAGLLYSEASVMSGRVFLERSKVRSIPSNRKLRT